MTSQIQAKQTSINVKHHHPKNPIYLSHPIPVVKITVDEMPLNEKAVDILP